ncbi:hypothetical protein [Enterovirga rhinocerotis]|uniref:Uncharacterized protein n=1 Tax=Enterovirga rhinocerotis TaxID=1339210 RepID=A0A4R7C929_9HYPH|nr:hypothetical protein [Enterovirga rhinocerotis]TDR93217.1 hypothetical protein EV668_0473 [Enterovirga rhinocerotis]
MRLSILSLVALLAAAPAVAREPAAALQSWGILGSWAPSCEAPPSDDNVYYIWLERDGDAFLQRKGGTFGDTSPISAARVTPEGLLEYHVSFGRQVMINSWGRGEKGIRIFANRYEGGRPTVRDGRLVHNGKPTPWHSRCDGAPA